MNKHTAELLNRLTVAGISFDDAYTLRRISMTLHRWHELECGDSNNHGSWAIERDGDEPDSKPYMVYHIHQGNYGWSVWGLPQGLTNPTDEKVRLTSRTFPSEAAATAHGIAHYGSLRYPVARQVLSRREAIADRETGARKRLAKIMAKYPGFAAYVQGDPRGAALYILRPGDIRKDADVSSCYSNGIAVYK